MKIGKVPPVQFVNAVQRLRHHYGRGGQRLVKPQKTITDPLHRVCELDRRDLGGELHRVSSHASS
ncbi:MAG: hypothetical protein QOF79_200, partial [Actinomycetota bacterium]|nr:hypothetical protein [Actinomycetota bacterium]